MAGYVEICNRVYTSRFEGSSQVSQWSFAILGTSKSFDRRSWRAFDIKYQTSWIELRMQSRQVKLSVSVASCIIENLTWFWICDDEYIVFTSFKTTQVLFKIFVNIGLIKRDSHTADQGLSRASKVAISFLHDLPVGHDTARNDNWGVTQRSGK